MSASSIFAIYAAVVATGALGWQIFDRLTSKRTKLEVTVSRTGDQDVSVRVVAVCAAWSGAGRL